MKKLLTVICALVSSAIIAQPCSNLFFSEYVEGTSNNKALEIYNPSPVSVNLSGYKVQLYTNGSATPNTTFNLSGSLAAGATYVIANSQANAAVLAVRDTVSGVTAFNGNDAIALASGTTILDVIGIIGNNPDTSWAVGSGFTRNFTLVRKTSVNEGTTNWTTGATQWDVLPIDDFSDLGSHTITPCAAPSDTIVRFSPNAASVAENAGTYSINVQLNQL
jgi:2',3'-cyclic-nucleotide 2'-phosphodiesterase / 3'-nucleotidase / 5'-nucleotidase